MSINDALEPNESAHIEEMIAVLRTKIEKDYAKGTTLRDAHPKSLGVLRGIFRVETGLASYLRHGIFANPQEYGCWIRMSNSSGKPQSDTVKDLRGVAIKLMQGEPDHESPLGQDFVLMNMPTMPLGTVKIFRDAVCLSLKWSPLIFVAKMVLTGNLNRLQALNAAKGLPTSMLQERYWSTTPYALGEAQAVKYSMVPTSEYKSQRPAILTDAYLSETMQAHLKLHEARFDFCVQLKTESMSLADAGVEWRETDAPFIKVATLIVPKQSFYQVSEREALSEVLSFSPGHALSAHRPLGALNRARAQIYKALSEFRHVRDSRPDIGTN